MDLPEAFLKRMKERLGSEFPAFLRSYDLPARRALRVNTLKISREEFVRRSPFALEGQIAWEPNGFYLSEEKPGGDIYHFAGLYYLQEPSAMAAAALVQPGERILDLCAAPGGKATQLAQTGKGILIANEINFDRAKILGGNLERMGIGNSATVSASPGRLSEQFPEYFDTILVDAPCSGEGMFKKEPNAIPEWSEENVLRCAARQREILDRAAEMLCAGGTLVYSTCTFAEEEDEWQIEDFLKRHSEFELSEQEKLFPHRISGEGHFIARLKKTDGGVRRAKPYPVRRNAAAERAFRDFADDFFSVPILGAVTTLSDGRMYLVPEGTPDFGKTRMLNLGVELGEWDGRVFKPAHALAMAFGAGARRKAELTREEAERYLRGETLNTSLESGWCAVCVEEFPLGLGKTVGGVIKNHLPKSLRKFS